jgi:hypothetical protein
MARTDLVCSSTMLVDSDRRLDSSAASSAHVGCVDMLPRTLRINNNNNMHIPRDIASAITTHVADGDLLAWVLTWRGAREAQVQSGRALMTTRRAMVASVERARWAVGLGMPCDCDAVRAAAAEGRLEVLMCLHGEGCCQLNPWDYPWAGWAATKGGHLDVLMWLHGEGCPLDADACMFAAGSGHLEVLKWAGGEAARHLLCMHEKHLLLQLHKFSCACSSLICCGSHHVRTQGADLLRRWPDHG